MLFIPTNLNKLDNIIFIIKNFLKFILPLGFTIKSNNLSISGFFYYFHYFFLYNKIFKNIEDGLNEWSDSFTIVTIEKFNRRLYEFFRNYEFYSQTSFGGISGVNLNHCHVNRKVLSSYSIYRISPSCIYIYLIQ